MKLEFVARNGRDGLNPAANTGRFMNCYIEPIGGRAEYQIRAVPGMASLANLNRVFMRDLHVFNGKLMALCGGVLSSVAADGASTDVQAFGDSEDSGLSQNTGYLTIVSNGDYWTWDGTTVANPATGALTGVSSVAYIGGYTVLSERGGRKIQWSALVDPNTFNGLHFASAEITDEAITRLVAMKDVLIVFKASSMELWQVTGLAGAKAFQRIPGSGTETGLKSYGLVTTLPNSLAFVGNDGRVWLWGSQSPISTPQVEVAISEYEPSRMFYYERRGHGFICITFRHAPAWCYDIATGEWHERSESGNPWSVTACERFNGAWHVGTDLGRVSVLTEGCEDHGEPLIRTITSMPVQNSRPFKVPMIEVFPRVGMDQQAGGQFVLDDGVSALSDTGIRYLGWPGPDANPARIGLQVTRDGVTWGQEVVREVGEAGRYDTRVTFRNLGRFPHMGAFRVNISSTVDIPILSSAEVLVA